MAIPKHIPRQRDFSGGQLDEHAKRGDDLPIVRAGARQARNFRIVNSRILEERPSRSILFADGPRVDEVRISSDVTYRICFSDGALRVRTASDGVVRAAWAGFPWTDATVKDIVWSLAQDDVVICYPGMRPVIVRRLAPGFEIFEFDFSDGADGFPRAPFMRVPSTRGIGVTPGGYANSISLVFDDDVLSDDHVGALFRIANKKVEITAVTDEQNATATVLERLLPQNKLTMSTTDIAGFSVGQVVVGDTSDAEGEVLEVDTVNGFLYVQILNYHGGFGSTEVIVGPNQKATLTAASQIAAGSLKSTVVWDEQIISDVRGWPQSVSTDRNRLIFSDIPGVPECGLWSAIDAPYDFEIDGTPSGAIGEFMAGKPRVYHILGGPDQFVFTDQGLFYIPISESNPLKSGSVTFRPIPSDVYPSSVLPAEADEGIVFLNAELTRVMAVIPTGQTATPYLIEDLNEWHTDLLVSPIAIAVSKGAGTYPERYLIVVNSDGTLVVGKRTGKDRVGWVPWDGEGLVTWCSARVSDVVVTTTYSFGGVDRSFCEAFDPDIWVDAAVLINDIPVALAAGAEGDVEIFSQGSDVFGDMTLNAGLDAAFESSGVELAINSARANAVSGYIGLALPRASTISQVKLWPSSDNGYVTVATSVAVDLYGANDEPGSGTDGTLLGTTTISDTTSGPLTLANANEPDTEYAYVWAYLHDASAANVYAASLRFYVEGQVNRTASGGSGDLWFMAGGTVDLMDGYRVVGSRTVDADGNLVSGEGDDLTVETLAVGLQWDATFEPILFHAEGGQSVRQTQRRRKLRRLAITVQNATGFICGNRRIATFNQGEDQSEAPPVRETTHRFALLGRSFDPRIELTKDSPGPLRILEVAPEITV